MKIPRSLQVAFLVSTVLATPLLAEEVLLEGDFTTGTVGELPEGWTGHQPAHLDRIEGSHELVAEGGESFLRLTKENEESVLRVQTVKPVPKGTETITVTVVDRVIAIVPGSANPNRDVLRVGVGFLDASNQMLKAATPQISRNETTSSWKPESVSYDVPEGTENVSVDLTILSCTGIWEIQSVEVTTE